MKIGERSYQTAAVQQSLKAFETHQSALVVMPTGTGKTIVFAKVGDAKDWGRVLVLAPRRELIYQAQEKIYTVTGDMPDIEMADEYAPTIDTDLFASSKYVVGSVQTLAKTRRLSRFNWRDFGLVILDEGHHAIARSWRKIIDHIKEENPAVRILLVTATPDRADGKAMGQVADTVAYRYEINDAMDDGYLVPVHQYFANISGLDLSAIRTSGGDLDEGELSALLRDDGGEMPHKVARAMVRAADNERSLIFTVDVAHAKRVADIINRMPDRKGGAVAVDGTWDDDRRKAILAAHRRHEFQHLVNCALYLEGYDDPGISVIGMARPTKSRALYAQAVGRGLRTLPGLVDDPLLLSADDRRAAIASSDKPRALVVDLAGNSGRHKLVCTADLLGGSYEEAVVDAARKRAAKRKSPVDMKVLLEEEKERLALQREANERRRRERKAALYGEVKMEMIPVNPFERDAAPAPRDGDFKSGPEMADDGQVEFLEKLGVPAMGLTRAEASKLLREHFHRKKLGLASLGQKRLLEKHGVENAQHVSKKRAAALIDLIAANGWKLPEQMPSKEQLTIAVRGDKVLQLRWQRPDGKKVDLGKPFSTVEDARTHGKELVEG